MPNHLAGATSPYLMQHALNPVDWYPWGEEALGRARAENKPILLSIGYSACHWCHVMAHESFENEATARLLNEHFINIKVDREERPDLDSLYMAAVQSLTGQGGWPLTVFLLPDGAPFYGGTYFPPEERAGLPSFRRVLTAVHEAFTQRLEEISRAARQIVTALAAEPPVHGGASNLKESLLSGAYRSLHARYEPSSAGFGSAPKFPQPLVLDFLLRYYQRTGEKGALVMVERSLEAMYRGGIYDHLGGGFHRYATDTRWQVPHFEKMLYDNALLARVYLHAWQLTRRSLYRFVAVDTIDYVLRELTDPATGGFYSSQDADVGGVEGQYYVWTPVEIEAVLGPRDGADFCRRFGVTSPGNFEGKNILHLAGETRSEPTGQAQASQLRLREHRAQRLRLGKDTKVLASWNALMLASLVEAACILDQPAYLAAALKNAAYLLESLGHGGRLQHTAAVPQGFLEDYAALIDGLLWCHQASLSLAWLTAATQLSARMVALFWDEAEGVFYETSKEENKLFQRPRHGFDGVVPSGSALATTALLKLMSLTDNRAYRQIAERALVRQATAMENMPLSGGQWLAAFDFYLGPTQEVVIIGDSRAAGTQALSRVIYRRWQRNIIVAGFSPTAESGTPALPIFQDRGQLQGEPTAYVCRNQVCLRPVTRPEELEGILARGSPDPPSISQRSDLDGR